MKVAIKKLLSVFAVAGALGSTAAHAHYIHPFVGLVYGCPGGAPTAGFVKHYYTGDTIVPLGELVNPSGDCAGLTLLEVRVEARNNADGGPQIGVLLNGIRTSVPVTVRQSGTGPYYFPAVLNTPSGIIAPTASTINMASLEIVGDVWIDRVILIWGPPAALAQQPMAEGVTQQAPIQAPAPIQK